MRQLNADTTARLLTSAPQPLVEGRYALRVLQTRGRTTGQLRRTPLGVTQLNSHHYLVSPVRHRDWVRNLTAYPHCVLLAGTTTRQHHATPITGPEAVHVVATYLSTVTAPWALRAFPVTPDASDTQIAEHLNTITVFRLDPPSDDRA